MESTLEKTEKKTRLHFNSRGCLTNIFRGLSFVASARKIKDNQRYALSFVWIKDGKAVGTDGKRLHIYQNSFFDNCEEGLWEVLKQTRTEIDLMPAVESGNFPKYEDIIPKDYTEFFEQAIGSWPEKSILNALYGFHGKNIGIELDFISALSIVDTTWKFWFKAPDRPIVAKAEISEGENCLALIMPYNLEAINYQALPEKAT